MFIVIIIGNQQTVTKSISYLNVCHYLREKGQKYIYFRYQVTQDQRLRGELTNLVEVSLGNTERWWWRMGIAAIKLYHLNVPLTKAHLLSRRHVQPRQGHTAEWCLPQTDSTTSPMYYTEHLLGCQSSSLWIDAAHGSVLTLSIQLLLVVPTTVFLSLVNRSLI